MVAPLSGGTPNVGAKRPRAADDPVPDGSAAVPGSGPLNADQASFSGQVAPEAPNPAAAAKAALDQQIMATLPEGAKVNFEALTRVQRDQYQSLYLAVGDDTRSALAKLLQDGHLVGAKPLVGDREMLSQLAALLKPEQLAPELRSDQLAKEAGRNGLQQLPFAEQLIREAADPGQISQRQHNTCGATTIEYLVAKKNPAEFVRIASALASPEGIVTFAGGQQVDIHKSHGLDFDNSGRTDVDRLMQSALMDAGRTGLFDRHYDNRVDKGSFLPNMAGFSPTEMTHVLAQVLKEDRVALMTPNHSDEWYADFIRKGADFLAPLGLLNHHLAKFFETYRSHTMVEILDRVEHSLAKGDPVPVLTSFTEDGSPVSKLESLHYLAVVGLDRQNRTITLRNPWGDGDKGSGDGTPKRSVVAGAEAGTVTMTFAEFEKIARAVYPDEKGTRD